jgi:hypothetical protein
MTILPGIPPPGPPLPRLRPPARARPAGRAGPADRAPNHRQAAEIQDHRHVTRMTRMMYRGNHDDRDRGLGLRRGFISLFPPGGTAPWSPLASFRSRAREAFKLTRHGDSDRGTRARAGPLTPSRDSDRRGRRAGKFSKFTPVNPGYASGPGGALEPTRTRPQAGGRFTH